MNIRLIAFGIAKDILNTAKMEVALADPADIKSLKERLTTDYPGFAYLAKLSFAVNEEYRDDDFTLKDQDEVVIIPPVSGG